MDTRARDRAIITGYSVYHALIDSGEMPYAPLDLTTFAEQFAVSTEGCERILYADPEGRGFSAGVIDTETGQGYVTFVAVRPENRRQGLGTRLLRELEEGLRGHLPVGKQTLSISFLNPSPLTWHVPGTAQHDHPNAPGVLAESAAASFYQAQGYRPLSTQLSYYLDLEGFAIPEGLLLREQSLAAEGITIETYDPTAHVGMLELMVDLDSAVWMRDIVGEIKRGAEARPILVPVQEGQVYGFAGPLDRQVSGRGYFAGIAVHSAMRRRGIASMLFARLCQGLHERGAEYMTLFTGEQNPARRIYEQAGFRVVARWLNLRKEFET